MNQIVFEPTDFDVFTIPGLEARMEALIERVRPKLTALGEQVSPFLSVVTGEEIFPHVAKHARRTVNPPADSWVAFAANKRGYKAHPHFQIGLFSTHLFIQFAIIYESTNKAAFAEQAISRLNEIMKAIPGSYVWSGDHTLPEAATHSSMHADDLQKLFERLHNVKASEILCGIHLDRNDERLKNADALIQTIESTFQTVLPLYKMART